jgi:hypothetical protein
MNPPKADDLEMSEQGREELEGSGWGIETF